MKKQLLLLASGLVLFSCTNNYSSGKRIGVITTVRTTGVFWSTWEVDLKVAPSIDENVGKYETEKFSIDYDKIIDCKTSVDSLNKFLESGDVVVIDYQCSNTFNFRGETNSFIKSVKKVK